MGGNNNDTFNIIDIFTICSFKRQMNNFIWRLQYDKLLGDIFMWPKYVLNEIADKATKLVLFVGQLAA